MKKITIIISLALICYTTITAFNNNASNKKGNNQQTKQAQSTTLQINGTNNKRKEGLIQVALLLDISGSMHGLINQAQTELWNIVNVISKAKNNTDEAQLEIALYTYGGNHNTDGDYINQVLEFTGDLDNVSEKLFALNIQGSEEYCGAVIKKSLEQLKWELSKNNYSVIFIAGNEAFNQGPINYNTTCAAAAEYNLFINTIHCGNIETGIKDFWKDGATAGNGSFFNINQNSKEQYIVTPYDSLLDQLNNLLNKTYWEYGKEKNTISSKAQNQSMQDKNSMSSNKESYYSRTLTKSSCKNYANNTKSWDINSLILTDSTELTKIENKDLPAILQDKSLKEKKLIIKTNLATRDSINNKIILLSKQRAAYKQEALQQQTISNTEKTLGMAIAEAIKSQASKQGFTFME